MNQCGMTQKRTDTEGENTKDEVAAVTDGRKPAQKLQLNVLPSLF